MNTNQIDDVVSKLFGAKKKQIDDVNHPDFAKFAIEQAPDVIGKYFEYTADRAVRDFLFEHSEIGIQLKKIMDQIEKMKSGNYEDDVNN
jgi:hypothetical protein